MSERSSCGSTPLREAVHGERNEVRVAGALTVAEERALHAIRAGEHTELRGRHPRTPVVMRVQADHAVIPLRKIATEPLDLIA